MIYKILGQEEWRDANANGVYEGSADDARDGFIHFSAAGQLAGTAAKHFAGRGDLVLVAVDESVVGDALKWEASRGGALFPHLYDTLDMKLVAWIKPMPLGDDGVHIIPEEVR